MTRGPLNMDQSNCTEKVMNAPDKTDSCEAPASRETLTQTQWVCVCANVLLRRLVDRWDGAW